ncbi:hypothetical protein AABB24_027808 [Solanum stoloniferum]|uniref:Inositol monophosphatase n=1 Tax=Solanum stoloniferum TaxID=62892 RepID=A0ABD2S4A6_9SOLN
MLTNSSKEESLPLSGLDLDRLVDVANKAVDAVGEIILRHYLARGSVFKVSDANVPSYTNIAAEAEKYMISLILKDLPCHSVCGKHSGWTNCSGIFWNLLMVQRRDSCLHLARR